MGFLFLLLSLGLLLSLSGSDFQVVAHEAVGVCYGLLGNNLPHPATVVDLYTRCGIKRMRIYDANKSVLLALRNSGIELILGVANSELPNLATAANAEKWVQDNVRNFHPSVKIRYIAVGNEVDPHGNEAAVAKYTLPALKNIYNAICAAGLKDQIRVSVVIDMRLLGISYPPSFGAFRPEVVTYIKPIVDHLAAAKTPLLANVYPYFSYIETLKYIKLEYALFTAPGTVVYDVRSGLSYQNLFDAQMDAMYAALERLGQGGLEVVVSETGWPSRGNISATVRNANIFLKNLIAHVQKGTPKRPKAIETYIFAMFDENMKPGARTERFFGLFRPKPLRVNAPSKNGTFDVQELTKDRWDPLNSLALSMSQEIVNITKLPLLHTIIIDSDDAFSQFTQGLHENSIQTISISHHTTIVTSAITDSAKNIILILDDVHQLFDLIFYTISQSRPPGSNGEKVTDFEFNERGTGYNLSTTLPRYCINIDKIYHLPGQRENCSQEVNIKSSELKEGSILSDSVYEKTRGLHLNNIWNHKNHLIFMLKNVANGSRKSMPKSVPYEVHNNSEREIHDTLLLCFKFFWRFFKGQKTVICHQSRCNRYDPFEENLMSYEGETDEKFFDFSWKNMHARRIGIYLDMFGNDTPSNPLQISSESGGGWLDLILAVNERFERSVNCTLKYYNKLQMDFMKLPFQIEDGLRFDIELILFDAGLLSKEADFLKFDFSIGIDTNALCIATPHSSYMPQGLVIFQGFSPVTWVFIAVTVVSFVFIQYLFQYSQSELFHRLYTEAEIDNYRDTSSLLTIYAYFICGSPPSLHLGRLTTGKILFLIFSFSAIIISTLFLNGMTTLLSNRVLYPEIDSLKSLEGSNLFIQIKDVSNKPYVIGLLDQLNHSEALKAKKTDSQRFYSELLFVDAFTNQTFTNSLNDIVIDFLHN
ncbi:unnamed protein product [Bemisia tabaci]|uniref:Glucan endo-1,3-beta-D-glucosidase n=2 Tax=Bemisia tabaci TaxID=7038 RepID=A0A9P0ALZ9_BEMTA|nr:unnamed protein product [Bemisia tabaci]